MHADSNATASLGAEPIDSANLKKGEVYVRISYIDPQLLNPVLQVLIYSGVERGDLNEEFFVFSPIVREADSRGEKVCMLRSGMKNIFDLRKGADEIVRCAFRREALI